MQQHCTCPDTGVCTKGRKATWLSHMQAESQKYATNMAVVQVLPLRRLSSGRILQTGTLLLEYSTVRWADNGVQLSIQAILLRILFRPTCSLIEKLHNIRSSMATTMRSTSVSHRAVRACRSNCTVVKAALTKATTKQALQSAGGKQVVELGGSKILIVEDAGEPADTSTSCWVYGALRGLSTVIRSSSIVFCCRCRSWPCNCCAIVC